MKINIMTKIVCIYVLKQVLKKKKNRLITAYNILIKYIFSHLWSWQQTKYVQITYIIIIINKLNFNFY